MAVTRASNDATPQKKRKRAVDEEEQGGKRKAKFAEKKTPPSAKPKSKKSAAKRPKSESGYSVKKNEVVALLKRWKSMKPLTFKEDIKYAFYKGDPLYGRININCRISYVRDIENKLTGSDWRRILASPFGNVMKMLRQVTFSSQTVHSVLFKQLKSKKKWETWYEIGGKVSRFSMKEFALITGLNCGQMPPESVEKKKKKDVQVMEKFFGGPAGPKTTVQDLYERFRDYRVIDNYKLKMALLLIVEGIFLGGDKKRLVKAEHVKLLDNMDKFWDYPWGRVAYKEFHRSLTKSLARRMLTVEKALLLSEDARIPYTIQGMPVVFQVWIWECVQSFGVQYASKINETAIPRGLRWYSEQCPEHGLLQLCFADRKLKVLPILIADESEKSLLSACRFHDEVKDPFFDKIVSEAMAMGKANAKLKEPNKGKEAFKGEVSGDANARQMMDIIRELSNKFDKMEHGLCERIDRLESKNVQVFENVPKRKKRMVKKSEAQASDSDSEEFDGVDDYLDDSEGSETELATDSEGSDNEKSEDEDEDDEEDEKADSDKAGSEDEAVGEDEEDEKAGSDKAFSEEEGEDEKVVSEYEKAGSDKAISEEEGEDEKAGTDKAVSGDHNLMDVDNKGNETEEGNSESIIEKEQDIVSEAFEQNPKDKDVNLDNSGLPIQVDEEVCGGNNDSIGDDVGEKNHKLMDDDTKANEKGEGNSEPIIEKEQEFVSEALEQNPKDKDVKLDNSGLPIQVDEVVCGGNDDGGDDGGEINQIVMDDDTKHLDEKGEGNSEPIIEKEQEFVSEALEQNPKDKDVKLDDTPRDSDENVAIHDNSGLDIQVDKELEENQELDGVGRRTGDIVMDVVADISEKLNDKDGVPDDDDDSDRTITDDVEDAPREEKESQEAEVPRSWALAVHLRRMGKGFKRSGNKEEVGKEEVGQEGDDKEEAGKETEGGKEEVGKVLGEKEEAGKEEVGKEGDDKEEAGNEEVGKEGIEEFSKGQVVFGNRKKAVGTSPKKSKSRYLPKRSVKPSASVLSPYRSKKQNNQKAKDNEKDKDKKKEVRGKSFWKRITKNPAVKEMTPFIEWYKDERPIEFRGVSNIYIDNDFMESIIEPTKWWGNLHLDEVLIVLRDALLKNPRENLKAAIMDTSWCEDYKDQQKCEMGGVAVPEFPDRVARYFRGELPIFHGKNWEEVDFIYAPLFVGTNHWVAIEIDLLNWSLSVFDCNVNLKRDHVIREAVAPIIKYLPKFMSKHEPLSKKYAHRGVSVLTYNGRVGKLEQNFRAGDCGVYTLKYIEWLSFGGDDLSLISDDTIDYHRFDIANSVFDKQWKTMLNYGQ